MSSMTPPIRMVSVPVDGQSFSSEQDWINRATRVLTSHPDYRNTEHAEETGWQGPHFTALCFDQAGRRVRTGGDFKRATEDGAYPVWWVWPDQIAAMLTAAPVREEGGAVEHPLYTVSEAARRQLVRAAGWIEKEAYDASGNDDPEDEGLDEAARFLRNTFNLSDEALGIVRNSSDEIVSVTALATREEAPAEAGESLVSAIDAFMPSAEVAFLWTKETPPVDEVQRYRDRYWAVKEALLCLRARPQAREEAQPVAWASEKVLAEIRAGYSRSATLGTRELIATFGNPVALYTTQPAPEAEKLRDCEGCGAPPLHMHEDGCRVMAANLAALQQEGR